MTPTSLPLPIPTNRTVSGPQSKIQDESAIVEYDHEADDGSTSWATITFAEVLEFRSRLAACAAADDILGANEMVCFHDSQLLRETIARWQDSLGWQKWQQDLGGAARFKHYKLYFDDAACFDVVAASYSVKSGRSG